MNWLRFSRKLVHADECSANVLKKNSYLYSSSVSQDIHDTHRHVSRSSQPVTPEPGVRLPHTQPKCDYLFLFHDERQNGNVVCGQPQMKLRYLCGEDRSNPFCHHLARGGRKHTGRKRKLEIAEGFVMQCDKLERSCQELHSHFGFRRSADL